MRPLRLELEGFTSFRHRTVIDFDQLDLFAITGPTGAGKSSLIDAICYALYGKIPRVNSEMASCISLGLDRLQVTFAFRAGEHDYRVYRETRRKGAPNVRLEYLLPPAAAEPEPVAVGAAAGPTPGAKEVSLPSTDWAPISQGSKDVTDRIERIVGLTYEGFTRSVLLPQGQFAEFLAGAPEKRRDVLRSLLRLEVYEQMRDRSSNLARDSKASLTAIENSLREQYGGATPENLELRRQELKAAEEESSRLGESRLALAEIAGAAERYESAGATAARALADSASAGERLIESEAIVAAGDAEILVLQGGVAAARERLEANEYDDSLLAVLSAAANVALAVQRDEKALAEAQAILKSSEAAGAAAEKAEAQAKAAHASATKVLLKAEAALEEARRHDSAAVVQAGLHAGDSCPVCGGVVGELPEIAGTTFHAAQDSFKVAQAAEKTASASLTATATASAVATTKAASATAQVSQLAASLESARAQLEEALPGFPDRSLQTIRGLLTQQQAAREERDVCARALREAETALQAKQSALASARNDLAVLADRQKTALATSAAAGQAQAEAAELLTGALSPGEFPDLSALHEAGRPIAALAKAQRDAAAIAEKAAFTSIGKLTAEAQRIEADIATAEGLRADIGEHKESFEVADDLAKMLMANRFQAFVQSEALRLLAEDGSEKLRELSNGRYRLSVTENGQDFEVIDEWNAGDRRPVRTLSGGETFLASLALALALAETLPGLAAGQRMALDSVFLDEGFGSLDQDSLRLAADALDSLRSGGRMVCVITHLPELAERLPARIEVTKSETGSTAAVV